MQDIPIIRPRPKPPATAPSIHNLAVAIGNMIADLQAIALAAGIDPDSVLTVIDGAEMARLEMLTAPPPAAPSVKQN